ncbi:MAG: hypothetical protein HRT68_10715, partial [Flavobacteriaceae bacterium]|nr:hypothetical protein [Flavobacteriaceae bacterium]
MKQIYMWVLVLLLYSINVNAQNFFNGSFENTTSTGCDYNNSNADFNGKMSNVFSFGNPFPEVDIKRLNCYADTIPDGDIVLGISENDAIAIELSSPLIAGQSYEMNFRAYGNTSFSTNMNDLIIGSSLTSNVSGTSIYTANLVADVWTTYSFIFVAPNNGSFITVSGTPTSGGWTDIDLFAIQQSCPTTVSFTAPADLCLDAGLQTGLGGGTPSTLVEINFTDPTNDGIFNTADATTSPLTVAPATAGTLGWFNSGGLQCFGNAVADYSGSPTVDGLFNVDASGNFSTPLTFVDGDVIDASSGTTGWGIISDLAPGTFNVGFRTLSDNYGYMNISYDGTDIIINRAVINPNPGEGITVGALAGSGVYSGPGVTDDGNSTTYTFDPAAAGVGIHTITYTYTDTDGCSSSASDTIEVFATTLTFTAPADLCIDAGVQTGLGGATPTGGVYAGPGVTDDGNGTTYSFDPVAAGVGVHTITYTDSNGCATPVSDTIEVFDLPTVPFTAPADLCLDAGLQTGLGGGTPLGSGNINFTDPTNDGIFNTADATTSPLTATPATAGTLGWYNAGGLL